MTEKMSKQFLQEEMHRAEKEEETSKSDADKTVFHPKINNIKDRDQLQPAGVGVKAQA